MAIIVAKQVKSTQTESKLSRRATICAQAGRVHRASTFGRRKSACCARAGPHISSRLSHRRISRQTARYALGAEASEPREEFEGIFRELPEEQLLQRGREGLTQDGEGTETSLDTAGEQRSEEADGEEGDAQESSRPSTGPVRPSAEQARKRILSKIAGIRWRRLASVCRARHSIQSVRDADVSAEVLEALDLARQSFEEPGVAQDVRAGLAAARIAHEAAATLETDPGAVRNGTGIFCVSNLISAASSTNCHASRYRGTVGKIRQRHQYIPEYRRSRSRTHGPIVRSRALARTDPRIVKAEDHEHGLCTVGRTRLTGRADGAAERAWPSQSGAIDLGFAALCFHAWSNAA